MDWQSILTHSLWAALFATGLGFLLTAPVQFLVPTFVCGFLGRFVRDVLMGLGLAQNWATVIAVVALVLVAAVIIRRRQVASPVVLICGVLPLGAAVAMFNVIFTISQVSSLEGEELSAASVALIANLGAVFTGSLAIAMGLGAGRAIVRRFDRTWP